MILLILFVFFWIFYLRRSYINDYFLNNCDYLWRLFRDNQFVEMSTWSWVRDLNTRDILEHYTKQLLINEFEVPYEKLLRDSNAVFTLANLFNELAYKKRKY